MPVTMLGLGNILFLTSKIHNPVDKLSDYRFKEKGRGDKSA